MLSLNRPESSEKGDEPVWLKQLGVNDRPLDVVEVGVVLKGSLQQSGFLAEAGDVRAVVVGEHVVPHDGIRNLRSISH